MLSSALNYKENKLHQKEDYHERFLNITVKR